MWGRHDVSYRRANWRFASKAKWVAGLGFWNARIPMLLIKPPKAPEMPVYNRHQNLEQPCLHCQQNLLPRFPGFRAQSLEHTNPLNKQLQRGQKTKSLCHFRFNNQTAGLEKGPALCPMPEITFQFVFQQNCWCLTESRETTPILTAIQHLGETVLEPQVVGLEDRRKQ